MSEVNKERGEVGITLDGKVYPMRPSYQACIAIEQEIGPVLSLVTRHAHPTQRLSMREMAIIVTETIRAAGKERKDPMLSAVTRERVGELLFDAGITSFADPLEELLINMISGGGKPRKKKDPAPDPETTPAESPTGD